MIKKKVKVWRYLLVWLLVFIILWYILSQFYDTKDNEIVSSQKQDVTISKINNKQIAKPKIIEPSYDFFTDTSITKYVWKGVGLTIKIYEPQLVNIIPSSSLQSINQKWNYHRLSETAYRSLQAMANDFYTKFKKPIVVYSAYRSYDYQKNSISVSCKNSWYCAKEWESEHQLGLAVDLWETTSETSFLKKYSDYYNRFKENAHKYWFHQSYQNWVDIDWYHEEPRHWRYLGIEMATYLYDNNITYTQFWTTKQ